MHKDVRDLFRTPRSLTYRQIIVWIRHLPEESALARRHIAGEVKPGDRDRLLAAAINELRQMNHIHMQVNSKEGTNIPDPTFIELPE